MCGLVSIRGPSAAGSMNYSFAKVGGRIVGWRTIVGISHSHFYCELLSQVTVCITNAKQSFEITMAAFLVRHIFLLRPPLCPSLPT